MDRRAKKVLLQWHLDQGVNETLAAEPVNRLAGKKKKVAAAAPAPAAEAPLPAAARPAPRAASGPAVPPSAAIAKARELADSAKTLDELREAVMHFDGCSLKKTATNTVFADGNPEARVMLIGEAPGAEEDKQGIPFCGASGKLLDNVFASIGLNRTNFYITNTLFWRPPGNRQPTPEELAICAPFVEKHIALINPAVLVLVGSTAAKSMLDTTVGITRLRGKPHAHANRYLGKEVPVFVTFHPSFLLRQPGQKKQAWQDMLLIEQYLATATGN